MDTSKDQELFNKIRDIEILLKRCDESYHQYCGRILLLKDCVDSLEDQEIKSVYEDETKKIEEKYKSENDERLCW